MIPHKWSYLDLCSHNMHKLIAMNSQYFSDNMLHKIILQHQITTLLQLPKLI